jgi:RNA polymerase sigma-70 factor (ECF subfamily)
MESLEIRSEMISLSDQEIINRVLSGEGQQYALIVRRYNARLYRIGMSLLNSPADVEDAMQLAYMKAYEHLKDFEHKSLFSTWLTRIFINTCLHHLKQQKQRQMRETDPDNIRRSIAGAIAQLPDKAVMNHELRKILEHALTALPEKYRMVFVMREVEDMSTSETMAALSLTESNVKVRLNRARTMLREKLNSYYRNEQVYHYHLTRCDKMVERVMNALGIAMNS